MFVLVLNKRNAEALKNIVFMRLLFRARYSDSVDASLAELQLTVNGNS